MRDHRSFLRQLQLDIPSINDEHLMRLLGTSRIPPRYQQLYQQLIAWGMPKHIAILSLLIRRIERGMLTASEVATHLSPLAATTATILAACAQVPRPSLLHIERIWQLFMLTCLDPFAGVLKITELLVQLQVSQAPDITVTDDVITAGAHAAVRLGMWDVRIQLMNARTRLADPHMAQRTQDFLEQSQPTREHFFQSLRSEIVDLLTTHGVNAEIERRQRPLYQVVEDGTESARGRFPWADVIVLHAADRQDCYRALGAINSSYQVVGAKVRDYIGGPKENGYHAIHTTVLHTHNDHTTPIEIHITTVAMDRYNRAGYLAYLAGAPPPTPTPAWLTDRQRWLDAYQHPSAELFVFTPQGETIFLPRGASVLDFAVRVHLDLGVYCQGALLNGHRTLPGSALECADICEVLIEPRGEPINERLLDLAHTTTAKARIRRMLRKDQPGAKHGQAIFRKVLTQRLDKINMRVSEITIDQHLSSVCRARGYQNADVFYRAVARGEAAPDPFVAAILELILLPRLDLDALSPALKAQIHATNLAQCCWPHPGESTVAVVVYGGHRLKIHTADCKNRAGTGYPVAWKPAEDQSYIADAIYESWDRPGLLHQMTAAISQVGNINIRTLTADVPEPRLARIRFSFEARSREQVEQVRQVLEQLPERRYVDLHTVALIDEGVRIDAPLDNPYGPHPVGRWPLFVGRDSQVQAIVAQLTGRNGARHVLVHGPKRIGKSSLLQHLSRYHLNNFTVPALLDLQSLPTEELVFPRFIAQIADRIIQKTGPRARNAHLDTHELARNPIYAFGRLLSDLRTQGDVDPFVMIIDELGVIMSRLRGSRQDIEFFDQWRALLNDESIYTHLAFIVAMPDSALPEFRAEMHVPLRAGELGYPVRLSVLDAQAARDLISAPVVPHLVYQPADLDLLVRETGGHPYYIHLVCGQIITALQTRQRKLGVSASGRQEIDSEIVRASLAVVSSNSDAFYHVLTDNLPGTSAVLRMLAQITRPDQPFASRTRLRTRLRRLNASYSSNTILRALEERPDLLREHEDAMGIRVELVARWLREHT